MPPADDASAMVVTRRRDSTLEHPRSAAVVALALGALAGVSASSPGEGALAAFTAAVLVLAAVHDVEHRIIPNRLVLPSVAAALAAQVAISPTQAPKFLLAGVASGLAFLIPSLINRTAMGMGDVKLAMLLGVALGARVVPAVMLAFAAVFPVALGTVLRGGLSARKATLPFGPFLAFGGLMILIVPRLVGVAGG